MADDPLAALPQGFAVDAPAAAANPAAALPEGFKVDETPQMTGAGRLPAMTASGLVKGLLGGLGAPFSVFQGAGDTPAMRQRVGPGNPWGAPADMTDEELASPATPGPLSSEALQGYGRAAGAVDRPDLVPGTYGERLLAAGAEGVGGALPYAAMGGAPGLAWGLPAAGVGGATGEAAAEAFPDHPHLARFAGNLAGSLATLTLQAGAKFLGGPALEAGERLFSPGAADRQGASRVAKAVGADIEGGGPTLEERLAEMQGGKPMTLMDQGENTQALGGQVYRQPGSARQAVGRFLDERDAAAGPRLSQDIGDMLSSGGSAFDTAKSLGAQRAAASRPLYEKAYSQEVPWTPRLQEFLDQPEVKAGLQTGMTMLRREAVARGEPFNPTDLGVTYLGDKGWEIAGVPKMRVLDAAKRGIDDTIDQARSDITGKVKWTQELKALDELRASYVRKLDSLNPDYAEARAAYSGPSQTLDALRRGQTLFSRRPEQIRDDLADLSAGDKDFYRLGAADALRQKIASTSSGGNEALRIVGNDAVKQQLRPLFDDEASYNAFIRSAEAEKKMFETRVAVKGGSQTGARLAQDNAGHGGAAGTVLPMVTAAASGEPVLAATYAGRLLKDMFFNTASVNPEVNAAAAKYLTATDPRFLDEVVRRVAPPQPLITGPRAAAIGLLASPATRER